MSRRLIQLGFIGWFCSLGAMTACGGDDDDGGGGSGGVGGGASSGGSTSAGGSSATGGSGAGTCVNIAGAWTVSKHCQALLVGQQIQVTQTGCMFRDTTTGISGTIDASGAFTASGMIPGLGSATCTGTATATTLTQNCMIGGQPCAVTLVR